MRLPIRQPVGAPPAMNLFCRLLGHTWVPATSAPEPRWNTTEEGLTLVATVEAAPVRHYEVCRRCGDEREVALRSGASAG